MPSFHSYVDRMNPANQFFRNMPVRAQAWFYAGIFFCFAPMGLLQEALTLRVEPWWAVAVTTAYSGSIAVLFAWVILRHPRWILLPAATMFVAPWAIQQWTPAGASPTQLDVEGLAALSTRLRIISTASIACMASAYICFVALVKREGLRYSGAHAEIRLARDIHAALVPDLTGQCDGLSWLGRSRPSGDVGGDLVDVVQTPRGWCATVADVSGHGVAAGVLMGMFKTAFRASWQDAHDVADAMTRVNRVIGPLRQPHMFITAACLQQVRPGHFSYVLAGHPPMLHISGVDGTAGWVGDSQLALTLMDHTAYTSGELALDPGDILLIVTDGLLEVFDRADRELGLDGLKAAAIAAARSGSLQDVERAVFAACAAHGVQLDDQTTLLIQRRREPSGHAAALTSRTAVRP